MIHSVNAKKNCESIPSVKEVLLQEESIGNMDMYILIDRIY